MVDKTGKSAAITAVVITATFVEDDEEVTAADEELTDPSIVLEAVPPVCLFPANVTPQFPTLRLPPVDGFRPSIHTRC